MFGVRLNNGMTNLSREDFSYYSASENREAQRDGFKHPDIWNCVLQLQAQQSLRELMESDTSLDEITATIGVDIQGAIDSGFSDNAIRGMNDDVRKRSPEIIGGNLALALSIPCADYLDLLDYTAGLESEAGGTGINNIRSQVHNVLSEFNLLNFYKILRSLPFQAWTKVTDTPEYHQMELIKIAVACDDVSMAKKLSLQSRNGDDFLDDLNRALSHHPYNPLSQVRYEYFGDRGISLSEVESRVFLQIEELERAVGVAVELDAADKSCNPHQGHYESARAHLPNSNNQVHLTPRYREYMSTNADVVMKQFSNTIGRSDLDPKDLMDVIHQILTDLTSCGLTPQAIIQRGFNSYSKAKYQDLIESPDAGRAAYLRELMRQPYGTGAIKTYVKHEFLRNEPFEEILAAARDDKDLAGAYQATQDKTYLQHMTSSGLESHLSIDMGL